MQWKTMQLFKKNRVWVCVCGGGVNSLVVQWLGVSAFTLVAQVQSLVGELRSHSLMVWQKKREREKREKQEQGGRDLHILQQCIQNVSMKEVT